MKSFIAASLIALASQTVYADGFVCENTDHGLKVKVFNHTNPNVGTRTAAIMVVSDTSIAYSNKTIAKFESVTGLLTSKGATYTSKVDLRFNDSGRKGELIGGTKLGQLAKIELEVAFTIAAPIEDGETTPGYLTLVKRNGEFTGLDMDCVRYLKN